MASPLAMTLAQQAPAQNMTTPNVAGTDVSGIYRDAYNEQMQKYQADISRSNAMWGGLAGLGGAGAIAFGPKLFGAGSAASGGAAAGGGLFGAAGGEAGTAAAAAAPEGLGAMLESAPWLLALL